MNSNWGTKKADVLRRYRWCGTHQMDRVSKYLQTFTAETMRVKHATIKSHWDELKEQMWYWW